MSVKTKLLEAVGDIDISDIGEEALVEILVNKIASLEKRVKELHGENSCERQRLHDETEALHRERHEMRRNPMYGAYGECYFLGRKASRFRVTMRAGNILELIEREKKIDFPLQRISGEQWGMD